MLEMYRLPDFLVIGAAKCGTTSLAAYLSAHSQIYMARPKELRFFSHYWDRGLDWYAERFEDVPDGHLAGEASVQYTEAPLLADVPERIASVMPDVRLIYLVRDPIEQIRSFYRHRVFKGSERLLTLDAAIRNDPIYLMVASYGYQMSIYLDWFDSGQILILDSSDLLHQRTDAVDTVLGFLGLNGPIPEDRLQVELNRGEEKDFLPRYVSLPRSLWRASRPVTGRIPRKWRHSVRRSLASPPSPSSFDISSDTRRWLHSKLEGELETLRRHAAGRLDAAVPEWLENLESS